MNWDERFGGTRQARVVVVLDVSTGTFDSMLASVVCRIVVIFPIWRAILVYVVFYTVFGHVLLWNFHAAVACEAASVHPKTVLVLLVRCIEARLVCVQTLHGLIRGCGRL